MKNILELTKKELKGYFTSAMAYIVIVSFLIISYIWFSKDVFVENQANMRNIFEFMPTFFIIIIPLLTMRSWAEERKDGTLEILKTLPFNAFELVISKFLSTLIFSIVMLLLLFPIPLVLNILGNPDNGVILAGFIGLIFLSATYISIGQFISINTKNQIISFIISAAIIGILYLVGEASFLQFVPNALRDYFFALGLGAHFRSIAKGVLDTRDVFYYLSIIILLITFIYKSLKRIGKQGS